MAMIDRPDDQIVGQMSLDDLFQPTDRLFAVSRIFARARKDMSLADFIFYHSGPNFLTLSSLLHYHRYLSFCVFNSENECGLYGQKDSGKNRRGQLRSGSYERRSVSGYWRSSEA